MRRWASLFLPFAGGYFLSYLFRTANAVTGPLLVGELGLSAGDLGLLTSTYFLTFAAAQLPLGMLLDRYGPRRVEAVLLLLAALGAAVFAASHSLTPLAVGRGLVGLGVSACLMAAFKAFAVNFPADRQASLTGWIMAAGSLGAVAAALPLELLLQAYGWRLVFAALAGLTVLAAVAIFLAVPEAAALPAPAQSSPSAALPVTPWQGVRQVFASAHFWRYAPLALAQIGGLQAIHGLWSASWLQHVNGYNRAQAAEHLTAMSVAMLCAYFGIGALATRLARYGIAPARLLAGGVLAAILVLLAIVLEASPHTLLLWALYGIFVSFGTLAYSQCAAAFPVALAGRANTAFNLLVFVGAFAWQWGIGLLLDWQRAAGYSQSAAHRQAFLAVVLAQVLAWLWLMARRPQEKRA